MLKKLVIIIKGFFVFSDEGGSYQQHRRARFIQAHPFYVRASVLMEMSDYIRFESMTNALRTELGIPSLEIKWSEVGSRFKGRATQGLEQIDDETVKIYIARMVENAVQLRSCKIFVSMFDNSFEYAASEQVMLKMHIQNALQRAQHDMEQENGFATMIIDDIGTEKNKALKAACHDLLESGDFVQYTNVKKSILTDFSHHCAGLQLADYCAGVFTSCLKRIKFSAPTNYTYAHNLMFTHLYKKVRHSFQYAPCHNTYAYGIREVPNNCGDELCRRISNEIDQRLDADLQAELQQFFE